MLAHGLRIVPWSSESRDTLDKFLLTDEIVFDSKPDAVPYNYRISYKVAQICLILLKTCNGRGGCSLVKLHIFSSALNTKESMKVLQEYLQDKLPYMIVRFDPAVNRAIKFASADGLICQLQNGKFRLSEKGKAFVLEIEKDKELMVSEKQYLNEYGKKLTDDKVETIMSTWRYKNDQD